jgi:hypothetical protein
MHHASVYIRAWDVTNIRVSSLSRCHRVTQTLLIIYIIVDSRFYMPLCRTYASLSLDCGTPTNPQSTTHHSSAQPLPTVPSPTPAASQPKVGKPIVKLPTLSSCHQSSLPRRFSLPRRSSLSRRSSLPHRSLLHRSSHPGRQIFPHFKPEPKLYRKVLMSYLKKTDKGREFLRMTKMSEALTANVTTDDQWTAVA